MASTSRFNHDPNYPQVFNSLNLVAMTILLFDHLLTFGDEVKYIWQQKISFFSFLFLTNRYYALVTMVCYVVGAILPYNVQEHIQPKFQSGVVFTLQTAPTIIVAEAMLVLRVYTVYQCNKLILACLTFAWMAHVSLLSYLLAIHVFQSLDVMRISYAFNSLLGLGFFLPPVLFDSVIASLLTFGLYQRSKPFISKASQPSLVNLIIRDGLLYFFAVFGSNIAWPIIGFIFHYKLKSDSLGIAPAYIMSSSITTTMIGRLTLSLRKYGAGNSDELTANSSSLRFNQPEDPPSCVISAEYLTP